MILKGVLLSEKQPVSKDCAPYNPMYMTFSKKIEIALENSSVVAAAVVGFGTVRRGQWGAWADGGWTVG